MNIDYIHGKVVEIGAAAQGETNRVRIERENAPAVTIEGLTAEECRAFAPFFMDYVSIQLPVRHPE